LFWQLLSYPEADAYDYDIDSNGTIPADQPWVVVGDYSKADLLRWVLDDPQSIAQVNARYTQELAKLPDAPDLLKFANDSQVTATVMGSSSLLLAAQKISATLASSTNKIRYLIGTFIGFIAVINIIPFSISIITGIATGVKKFVEIVGNSKAITHESDIQKVKGFNALMILLTSLVTCIPILIIPIFVYQSFADQFFVITVVGVMVFSFASAVNQYLPSPKWGYLLTAIAAILMILGLALWAAYDEDQLLLQAVLFGKDWLGSKNALWIVGFIVNFIFNFLFSRLIACNIVGYLTANMFRDFDGVYYLASAGEYSKSKLYLLNVWADKKVASA